MNTDIRIAVSFRGHRKRKKLSLLLGEESAGYLVDLWIGVAISRPEGVLTDFDAVDVALEANYNGDPEKLLTALIETGWIKRDDNGVLFVNDWNDHNAYASGAKKRSEAARKAARIRWKNRGVSCDGKADSCGAHKNAYAPSPNPNPNPNPSPKALAQKKPIRSSKKFADRFFLFENELKEIKDTGEPLQEFYEGQFNLWALIQKATNNGAHPAAIAKVLKGMYRKITNGKSETIKKPVPYFIESVARETPNYNEADHIKQAEQFKEIVVDGQFMKLIQQIGAQK
jgi:hypothetical protein